MLLVIEINFFSINYASNVTRVLFDFDKKIVVPVSKNFISLLFRSVGGFLAIKKFPPSILMNVQNLILIAWARILFV